MAGVGVAFAGLDPRFRGDDSFGSGIQSWPSGAKEMGVGEWWKIGVAILGGGR